TLMRQYPYSTKNSPTQTAPASPILFSKSNPLPYTLRSPHPIDPILSPIHYRSTAMQKVQPTLIFCRLIPLQLNIDAVHDLTYQADSSATLLEP
ncbi:hypothetical protein CRG98_040697, partial [Punica granatum]